MPSAGPIFLPFDGPGQDVARSLSSLDLLRANNHASTAPNEPFAVNMAPDSFERVRFCHRLDFLTGKKTIQCP